MGEEHFMRAFDYFKLVKQYGGVPLKIKTIENIEEEFTSTTPKDVYQQVINDFTQAYNLLPAVAAEKGRITKGAAAYFLAKAY